MFTRHIAVGLVVAPVLLLSGAACSTPDELCSLICDCEHCSELAESVQCETLALDQEVAGIYGCDAAWDSWAECVENNGECREDSATFTTQELDYCASFIDLQTPCATAADCTQPDAICNQGSCMRRSCNTAPTQPCSSDSDCPTGPDLCDEVRQALLDCEQAAAGIVIGSGYTGGPRPQPNQ